MSQLTVTTIKTENSTTPLTLTTGNATGAIVTVQANSDVRVAGVLRAANETILSANLSFDETLSTKITDPGANTMAFHTAQTERMRIDSSGRVGIGTNAPDRALSVAGSGATIGITNTGASGGTMSIDAPSSGVAQIDVASANAFRINTNSNERMRIDSSGNIGIGTASPSYRLDVVAGTTETTDGYAVRVRSNATAAKSRFQFTNNGATQQNAYLEAGDTQYMAIATVGTERVRIDSSGNILFNTLDTTLFNNTTGTGVCYRVGASFDILSSGDNALIVNRVVSDGSVIEIRQDGVVEGAISVAGTTVTYGAFSGSHWSQLSDNSRPDILRGTVVETINEKCEWPGQENDQLVKFKVSDTPASKRVYGVFMSWDNDDNENNDAYITSLGAYLIRIAAGHTVEGGDLLESNGDGCARVQSDDIIRSSTIGKVTSNIPTETYADGSYIVPCVLYCG